jgi:hypothetical protein
MDGVAGSSEEAEAEAVTESAASIVDLRLAGWPAACELQTRAPRERSGTGR